MEEILKTFNLTKKYKDTIAVDGININVSKGDIYCLLGPNGAGKTTLIRMIMGLINKSSGKIELFGKEIRKEESSIFSKIGAMIEFPGFYPNLTAYENLDIQRKLMGIHDKNCIEEALEITGIDEYKDKLVKEFSLGMKQRLGISRALIHSPELLILDEPTNGLDPIGIREVRQLILDLSQKRNITVILSSHFLSEVQQLASKIAIMHKGKLLEEIDYKALEKKNKHYIQIKTNEDKTAALILEQKLNINEYVIAEKGEIRIYERLDESAEINKTLVENKVMVKELVLMRDSLEDYFVRLTGGNLSD